jgi:hypothetical protein
MNIKTRELPYLTILIISFLLGITTAISLTMLDYDTESIFDLLSFESLPAIMIYSTVISTVIFLFLLISISIAKFLYEGKNKY